MTSWATTLLSVSLVVIVASTLISANDEGPPRDLCSGSKRITSTNGTISDHEGGGPYQHNSRCEWVVSGVLSNGEPADQVVLTFSKFDVEYLYDTVGVYKGKGSFISSTVQWFTGEDLPTYTQQPIVVDGADVTILFASDVDIAGAGFRLTFQAVDCRANQRCNGQGLCVPNGNAFRCECFGGWQGPNCSEPQLSPAESDFCFGEKNISSLSGTIAERNTGSAHLNMQSCSWNIDPSSNVVLGDDYSLDLYFNRFDTELGYDFVYVRDSEIPSNMKDIYSGYVAPRPIRFDSGLASVSFTSDPGIVRSGFRATFTTSVCSGGCNNGTCMNGLCVCDYGFTGAFCNQTVCEMDCNRGSGWGTCNTTQTECQCNGDRSGPDCSICLTCSAEQCATSQTLTDSQGYLSDFTGNACQWTIRPSGSVEMITLSFILFNLDSGSALIVKTPRGEVIKKYNGSGLYEGKLPPPLHVPSNQLILEWTGQSPANTPRFQAVYNSYLCGINCNGHGQCFPLDFEGTSFACRCNEGWQGETCDTPTCPGDCFGRGVCTAEAVGSTCVCEEGYFGPSCSIPYCPNDRTINLTAPSGAVKDHYEGMSYREGSRCSWIISPAVGGNVTLYFTRLALWENTPESVSVYDGSSTTAPLIYTRRGSRIPPPVTSTSGSLFVTFSTSNPAPFLGPLTGIDARYIVSGTTCANGGCGRNGYCDSVTSECVCFDGAAGTNCQSSASTTNAALLHPNQSTSGTVRLLEWKYYRIAIPDEAPYRLIVKVTPLASKKRSSSTFLSVYARPGALPSNSEFDTSDLTSSAEKQATTIAPQSGDWFVGVQNLDRSGSPSVVSFTISYSFACPDNGCENGGTCSSSTNYACDCPSSWTGSRCEVKRTSSDAWDGVIVAVILFLIFVAISVVVVIVFLVYLRYNVIKGYFMARFVQTDMYSENPVQNDEMEMGPM